MSDNTNTQNALIDILATEPNNPTQNALIDILATEPNNPTQDDSQNTPIDNHGAEPTNLYNTIIEQQQAQIDALIAQTTALNNQIINMVNSGAQFNDGQQAQPMQQIQQEPLHISLSDDMDYSLESLAKEIGKR